MRPNQDVLAVRAFAAKFHWRVVTFPQPYPLLAVLYNATGRAKRLVTVITDYRQIAASGVVYLPESPVQALAQLSELLQVQGSIFLLQGDHLYSVELSTVLDAPELEGCYRLAPENFARVELYSSLAAASG